MDKPDVEKVSLRMEMKWTEAESRIIQDIARRIRKSGKITSSADYQINRLVELGRSTEEIEKILKEALGTTREEMYKLYDDVANWQYVRNKDLYEQINREFIPPEENEWLKQTSAAAKEQTADALTNLSMSYGFAVMMGTRKVFMPFSEYYQKYVDAAIMDIISGGFDYNTVIRRVVTQMTNSGLRTVDYASGHSNRTPVAVRRAVLTGVAQITGKISEQNAAKLGIDYYEVDWHSGARPEHRIWQGKVYSYKELETVCGLGTVTGLHGANCYHDYYPFIPGVSERLYTDEWLEEQNKKEEQKKSWNGKDYNLYEQTQKMRQMETSMRAQREKVDALKAAKADQDEITIARAKYQAQLNEYSRFCKKMGLKEQRERIYYDMRGRVASGNHISMEKGIANKRISKEADYSINRKLIDSNEYKRKYNGITGNTKVDEALYKYAKAGLIHRDGTNREDLYILSRTTGEILGKNISSTENFGVKANESITNAVKNNIGNTIGLHTHPDDTPPTGSDFETAFKRVYNFGTVACADGSVYIYGCSDKYISARIIDDTIEKYKNMIDNSGEKVYSNSIEAHLAALERMRKDYGIWYEAR